MKFPVIPRRIKISKRLAQCMHPALPSGVHLKALETYDIIFKCMGTNRLSHELFIYSAGKLADNYLICMCVREYVYMNVPLYLSMLFACERVTRSVPSVGPRCNERAAVSSYRL
jgi:hypothetical protein